MEGDGRTVAKLMVTRTCDPFSVQECSNEFQIHLEKRLPDKFGYAL
jgi:hypothetical protein